jgi:hypothetical protein
LIPIAEAHVDDVGTEIRLTVTDQGSSVDLTGAMELTILLRKPSGVVVEKAAALVGDATAGVINCYTAGDDLDEAGMYFVQARIALAAWSGHSDKRQLRVCANVE